MNLFNLPVSQIPAFRSSIASSYYNRYNREALPSLDKVKPEEIAPLFIDGITKEEAQKATSYSLCSTIIEHLNQNANSFQTLEEINPGATQKIARFAFMCDMDEKNNFALAMIGAIAAREANLLEIEGYQAQRVLDITPSTDCSLKRNILNRMDEMFALPDSSISNEEAIERGRYTFGCGWQQNLNATKVKALALSGIFFTQDPTQPYAPHGAVALGFAMRFIDTFPENYQEAIGKAFDNLLNMTPNDMKGLSQPQKIYLYNTMGNIDDNLLDDEQKTQKAFVLASAISLSDEAMESHEISDAKEYLGELKENAGRLPMVQRVYLNILERRINALKELPAPVVD